MKYEEPTFFWGDFDKAKILAPRLKETKKYSDDPLISGDINKLKNIVSFLDVKGVLFIFESSNLSEKSLRYIGSLNLDADTSIIRFLDDTEVVSGHSDGKIGRYSLIKQYSKNYEIHNSSVRCMKYKTKDIFFSGDRQGVTIGWDMRIELPVYKLICSSANKKSAKKSITSIEFNYLNDYLAYTSETPGGIVGCWDLRYTERGKIKNIKQTVSERIILDLNYDISGLFALIEDNEILELSDLGIPREKISINIRDKSFLGSIIMFKDLNLMATVASKDFTLVNLETKSASCFQINTSNGAFLTVEGNFVSYGSDGYISEYYLCGI